VTDRRYRFDQLDSTGVLLGLGWLQLAALGVALLGVGLVVTAGLPGPLAIVPLSLGALLAFGRVRGRPTTEWVPVLLAWSTGRTHGGRDWRALIPLGSTVADRGEASLELPPCCSGLCIIEADSPWHRVSRVGLIRDDADETLSALIEVQGREFALLDEEAQEDALGRWGEVLSAFAHERGLVVRISWSEHAAPAGLGEHRRWLAALDDNSGPSAAYDEVVDGSRGMTANHQTIVTLTCSRRRLRSSRRATGDGDALVDATLGAVDVLLRGLRNAGVDPGQPMTFEQIDSVLGWRVDPEVMRRRDETVRARSSANEDRPLAFRSAWDHIRVDRSLCRSYWIAEWPRLPVPADWLEPVLAFSGDARRTVTVLYEPVAPSASKRRIDRDSVKLESDAVAREEKGRRVTAQHRRNQSAISEREQELVAGYVEFDYLGLVTVSAYDEEALWEDCAHIEQLFREHGLEIRALDGRHDLAWAATLPFGIGLGRAVAS
jgi:hypothetical protein